LLSLFLFLIKFIFIPANYIIEPSNLWCQAKYYVHSCF